MSSNAFEHIKQFRLEKYGLEENDFSTKEPSLKDTDLKNSMVLQGFQWIAPSGRAG